MRTPRARRSSTARALSSIALGVCALGGWLALFAAGSHAGEVDSPASVSHGDAELSVLSYNVHGLFAWAAKDTPRHRMRTIGWLARDYDVALLQEDFEYPDLIAGQMPERISHRGNGMGGDARRVAAKVFLFLPQLVIPRFSPPYGSGLTAIVRDDWDVGDAAQRAGYDLCEGWWSSAADCWARKGWLRVRVRMSNGAEVDLYNTHTEAGGDAGSSRVRALQLEALADAIEAHSNGRAAIVAGDLNVAYARPADRESIAAFRARLGLRDSGAAAANAYWRERDHILYRSGSDVRIEVIAAGEDTRFVNGDRALSDHPALFARLRVTPASADAAVRSSQVAP